MSDLTAFDPGSSRGNPDRAIEQLVNQLNRQGFIERSIVVPLRDRFDLGRDLQFFARSDTTTFETHVCPYNYTTTALGTVAQAINILIAIPFVASDSFVKDLLSFEVTTVSGAGGKLHIGIYDSTFDLNGTPYPGRLLVQAFKAQDVRIATGVYTANISWAPTYGRLYFMAYLAGIAITGATTTSVPTTNMRPFLGFPATLGAAPQYGYTVASTYSTTGLPSGYPAGATAITTGELPAIFLRSSAVQDLTRYIPVFSPSREGYILRRVKALSAAGTTITQSGAYLTIDPSIRTGSSTSSIGTFDTRTSKIAAGEPYYFGGAGDLDLSIPSESILEAKVTAVGWADQNLQDVALQYDIAFTGGQS